MNSLQLELDQINEKLELLTYRKTQLDSIMAEYSDVINRVKSLVFSMQDANVEPSNLLMEIEGIIYGDPEPTPEEQPEEQEPTPEEPKPFTFDLRLFPNPKPTEEQKPDTVEPEAPKLNALGLPIQTEPSPESKPEHIERYPNNIYWDNGSSVRVFIPKKRRYKLELEAIAKDCIEQGYSSKFEVVECDGDWLVMFSQVTSESSVQGIIDNFYPKHTDGEPEPKTEQLPLLNLMVPVVDTSIKSQLNSRAWKRNNTLLIGFSNKKLMKTWSKWFIENWGDSLFVSDDSLEGFEHCLSVLWYNKTDWERLQYLDYSVSPNDQQPQTQEISKFEYRKATETMTQVFKDGVLLGIAIDKVGCFESPQFKGQSFDSLAEVSEALWELVNKF